MKMNLEFVKAEFHMMTGTTAVTITPISFNTFVIEASNGQSYLFKA